MELSQSEIEKNINLGKNPKNIALWAQIFFKEELRYSLPKKYHYEIYSLLYSNYDKVFITVPRGRGKTTLVKIWLTHRIVYPILYDRNGKLLYFDRMIAYKASTEKKAAMYVRNILDKFEYDDFFIQHYGELKDDRNWTGKSASFMNGVTIDAFGADQSTRGNIRGAWRYTTIVNDDPDSLDDSKSKTIMDKHWEKIERDDLEALDKKYGKYRLIGTVVSADCCIQRAINYSKEEDPDWHGVVYRGLVNGESIWPEVFPTERVLKERDKAIKHNNYGFWLSENMNIISDENTRIFKKEYFRYYEGSFERIGDDVYIIINDLYRMDGNFRVSIIDDKPIREKVHCYIGIDPAGEDSVGDSDFWGITIIALDSSGRRFVAEFIEERMTSVEFIERLFKLDRKYNFFRGLYESNAGFGNIKSILYQEMNKRGRHIVIQWEKEMRNKKQRISQGLEAPWRAGALYHRKDMTKLEREALDHPNLVHEDGIDSLEKANRIAKVKPLKEHKDIIREMPNWRNKLKQAAAPTRDTSDIILTQG